MVRWHLKLYKPNSSFPSPPTSSSQEDGTSPLQLRPGPVSRGAPPRTTSTFFLKFALLPLPGTTMPPIWKLQPTRHSSTKSTFLNHHSTKSLPCSFINSSGRTGGLCDMALTYLSTSRFSLFPPNTLESNFCLQATLPLLPLPQTLPAMKARAGALFLGSVRSAVPLSACSPPGQSAVWPGFPPCGSWHHSLLTQTYYDVEKISTSHF